MFVVEVNIFFNKELEFSEKEDDEWIFVDFIGKVFLVVNYYSNSRNFCILVFV